MRAYARIADDDRFLAVDEEYLGHGSPMIPEYNDEPGTWCPFGEVTEYPDTDSLPDGEFRRWHHLILRKVN